MNAIIRAATSPDLARLMPLLDQQFVSGKGRSLSLTLRYPSVFCAANAKNIFLCEEDGDIVSALAVKHFDWMQDGRTWRGAMIGAVYTQAHRRGQGFASRLLHWVNEELKNQGADFGVLWTLQPQFYARLGWVAADCGLLGELAGTDEHDGASIQAVSATPIAMADLPQVEAIRQLRLASMCRREAGDYRQLPFPAEAVDLLLCKEGTTDAGYALLGGADALGIMYEMVGNPDSVLALLAFARRKYRSIIINDKPGSDSHRQLERYPGLAWEDKSLAMWLPLSGAVSIEEMSHWYIPYFDRM